MDGLITAQYIPEQNNCINTSKTRIFATFQSFFNNSAHFSAIFCCSCLSSLAPTQAASPPPVLAHPHPSHTLKPLSSLWRRRRRKEREEPSFSSFSSSSNSGSQKKKREERERERERRRYGTLKGRLREREKGKWIS